MSLITRRLYVQIAIPPGLSSLTLVFQRNAEISQTNFILSEWRLSPIASEHYANKVFPAVGSSEMDTRSVNVRNRDDVGTKARSEALPLDEVVKRMVALKNERRIENKL